MLEPLLLPTARGDVPVLAAGPPGASPVVCQHGFPDLPLTFAPLAERLVADGRRVIAPYLRGAHPGHVGHADVGTLAADLAAVCAAIGDGEPVDAVGHDWGASAVYGVTAAFPGAIGRGVAVAVPPMARLTALMRSPAQLRRSFYIWFFQLPNLPEAVLEAGPDLIDFLWATWSPGLAVVPHRAALHELFADAERVAGALALYRAQLDDAHRDPALSAVRHAFATPGDAPLLVLAGAEDGCIGPEAFDGIERDLPAGSRVDVIDGVGHFLHLEAPDLVADRIAAWFTADPTIRHR